MTVGIVYYKIGVSSARAITSLTDETYDYLIVIVTGVTALHNFSVVAVSQILYVNVTLPTKLLTGVYANEPSLLSINVPLAGLETSIVVKASLFWSRSLTNRPVVLGTQSLIFFVLL